MTLQSIHWGRSAFFVLTALLVACGGDPGGAVDASSSVEADAWAGEGVCCPHPDSPCSSTQLGGHAPTLEECTSPADSGTLTRDGWWTEEDVGGCPSWTYRGIVRVEGGTCCGCVPEDAGTDASSDAGIEGVCCPRDSSPCAPPAQLGGWAPSLEECPAPSDAFDGTWSDELDHDCPVWVSRGSAFPEEGDLCCGCAHDAGVAP